MNRCFWCEGDELYEKYHDEVWGKPVYDDRELFEFLTLEGAQAGLSWITILRRQAAYKKAFDGFDIEKVASYGDDKVEELMKDAAIIRNRLKIKSTIKNAKGILKIQEEYGSFSHYLWSYVDHEPILNAFKNADQVPAETELSKKISKDLKKRGFSFVGPTIIYAYMQAIGMVNDHYEGCHLFKST
ncbi:DNA-3-methyladenine glycosylase I [Acidaminobacter sp. JC074]|uniref:DNA-3-methyladenine glycosylase I n=1 Tax=Acidaminobacter sp. JC074 TaxID=2530199 RepID=UPI001F0EE59B|nr:DNA-3-methyladenine glycosylase I [Acidaminobacter sp. JC074]MCH4889899.1 DNA-3-methyladenine glycosylase I [Acidaminobacter sp. JC074]